VGNHAWWDAEVLCEGGDDGLCRLAEAENFTVDRFDPSLCRVKSSGPPGYKKSEFDGNGPAFSIVEAFTGPVRDDLEVGLQVQEKVLVLSLTPAVKLRGNFVHAGAVCVPSAPAEVLAAIQQNADENANEGTPKYKQALVTALQTTNLVLTAASTLSQSPKVLPRRILTLRMSCSDQTLSLTPPHQGLPSVLPTSPAFGPSSPFVSSIMY
jgi:hypothetical protein